MLYGIALASFTKRLNALRLNANFAVLQTSKTYVYACIRHHSDGPPILCCRPH